MKNVGNKWSAQEITPVAERTVHCALKILAGILSMIVNEQKSFPG
jgi:hypothetical protein